MSNAERERGEPLGESMPLAAELWAAESGCADVSERAGERGFVVDGSTSRVTTRTITNAKEIEVFFFTQIGQFTFRVAQRPRSFGWRGRSLLAGQHRE